MSADGSRIAIGAVANDSNGTNAGHVRVYDLIAGSWEQVGQAILGEKANEHFGYSIAMSADGDRIAIGAASKDSIPVRVYDLAAGSWVRTGQDIEGDAANVYFGYSIAMSADGDRIAIGTCGNDDSSYSGHVSVYDLTASSWVQAGEGIDGETDGDYFGKSVAMAADGNRIAVGAPENDGNGFRSGHVRVYDWKTGCPDGSWEQSGGDIDGEAENDHSGEAIAMSADGSRLAIGAPRSDDNGSNSGHIRVYGLFHETEIQFMVCSSAPARFVVNGPLINAGRVFSSFQWAPERW